jgi:hypothetical protein
MLEPVAKPWGLQLPQMKQVPIVYLLLFGGGKNTWKEQSRDIERAKQIKKEAEETGKW